MNEENSLDKPVIWTTREGAKIPITVMETGHLFNAMKMTFNHLAEQHGGEPVWFVHRYGDFKLAAVNDVERLARLVWAMLVELDTRKDLPVSYTAPLAAIREQVYGRTGQLPGSSARGALCAAD